MVAAATSTAAAQTAAPFGALTPAQVSISSAQEAALVQKLGIADSQAAADLQVERAVGSLNAVIEKALGDNFADVWFDPWHARFDVGVAPTTLPHIGAVRALIDAHHLSDVTSFVPVRYTYRELLAAKKQVTARVAGLMRRQEAATKIDASTNSVVVELSSAVPVEEAQALVNEALQGSATAVRIASVPPRRLQIRATSTFSPCTFEASIYDLCDPPLVGGVQIFSTGQIKEGAPYYRICTGGFMAKSKLPETYPDHYLLTAGHCFLGNEIIKEGLWYSAEHEANGTGIGYMGYEYVNEEGDAAFIDLNQNNSYWKDGTAAADQPYVYTPGHEGGVEGASEDYEIEGVGTNDPENIQYQVPCHSGWGSGVHCGVTEATDVTTDVDYSGEEGGTKAIGNLVENSACDTPGDSGGPWIFEHLAMGLTVSGAGTCAEEGGPTFFDDQHTTDQLLGMKVLGVSGPAE